MTSSRTLWNVDRPNLVMEDDILKQQVFRESGSYYEVRCQEPPNSSQDDPLFSQTPTPDFEGILTGKIKTNA